MSDRTCAVPASERQSPWRRGYVIIKESGCVRHIPLWWHPRIWPHLFSIWRGHRASLKRIAARTDPGSRNWIDRAPKGTFRTVPRDRDSFQEMGFYG